MKYTVTDSAGTLLTTEDFKTLISELNNSQEITLYFNLMGSTNAPGLLLMKSADLGEIDYPSKEAPSKDLVDLLHWGSDGNISGLYVMIGNAKTYFSFSAGSSFANRIQIPSMANLTINQGETQILPVVLGYDRNTNVSRRLYVGLELYDS